MVADQGRAAAEFRTAGRLGEAAPGQRGQAETLGRTINILALVTHINTTPTWDGALRFNLLTETMRSARRSRHRTVAKGPPRALRDPQDLLIATLYFQANGFPKANKNVIWDALAAVAHESQLPPGARLSEQRCGGTGPSGSARCSCGTSTPNYRTKAVKQERDRHVAYLEHISVGFMVGAVARVMDPGCKVDHVPVRGRPRAIAQEHCHPRAMP